MFHCNRCFLHVKSCTGPLQTSPGPSDPALDFFSEHFDALRALYTKGLQPPVPRVKALDNVVKCRLILPPELPDSWSAWNAAHPKTEPSEVPHTPPPPGCCPHLIPPHSLQHPVTALLQKEISLSLTHYTMPFINHCLPVPL